MRIAGLRLPLLYPLLSRKDKMSKIMKIIEVIMTQKIYYIDSNLISTLRDIKCDSYISKKSIENNNVYESDIDFENSSQLIKRIIQKN